ncbi:MAG: aryl-sulfate sulfotransferase [Planctomycetes bacterium]|nr:aryl-sulfate sulfotransferase [Planctomycetota bacterium]
MRASASLALLLVGSLVAQAAPGHRLFSPINSTTTSLVDSFGQVVHTWTHTLTPGVSLYLRDNGNLVRTVVTTTGGGGAGGGVQEIAFDGTLLWDFVYTPPGVQPHHDIALLPNGNVLMLAWEDKTPAEAIAAGRDPALIDYVDGRFRPDFVFEVRPTGPTTGQIVWEWHFWDHMIQDFDPNAANYGDPAAHPELLDINFPATVVADYNHTNSLTYDADADWILLSCPTQNELYIIDHSTTTAEAAGHTGGTHGRGGDLLYRWGNPAAYRAGTSADQRLFFQHSVKRIPPGYPGAGHVTVFNNQIGPGSRVWELELPLDPAGHFILVPGTAYDPAGPVWEYADPGLSSSLMSSCERLPNGNTLICSSLQFRVFEVSPSGQNVFEISAGGPFTPPFHATYAARTMWADTDALQYAQGGTVRFDLLPGTQHAGALFYVAGSLSGTTPGIRLGRHTLPLNVDPYLLQATGSPFLPDAIGTIDASGHAIATLVVPAGLAADLRGWQLDHAFLLADPSATTVTHASNPVGILLQ